MNVIIVENNQIERQRIELLLSGENTIGSLASFESADEAVKRADWVNSDILLTEIDLDGMSGVDLIKWTHENHDQISCMVFTDQEHRGAVLPAIRAGACGYLLKESSPRELVESILLLHSGGVPMSSKVARTVISEIQRPIKSKNVLTPREKEVFREFDKGLSYKEIAASLCISPGTVHTHMKNIYKKIGVTNKEEALRRARRMGWI